MPHRIPPLSATLLWVVDGIVLAFASFVALFDSLTAGDLTGPHALVIGAVAVSWVLWNNGKERDKKFLEISQRHHEEMMAANKEHNTQIATLTAESIKASFVVAGELLKLTKELGERPCCLDIEKP